MQTTIDLPVQPAAPPPSVVRDFDIESVRVAAEWTTAARLEGNVHYRSLTHRLGPTDPRDQRRRLLSASLRLPETMAPSAYQAAREAQRVLGVTGDVEIHRRNGAENPAIHFVEHPILIEVQASLLPLLDPAAVRGVFGHELGHYLAHGPRTPVGGAHRALALLGRLDLDAALESELGRLSMLAELTADRVALLACQDVHAMLRLEMVMLTGLSADALTWDTEAYLGQCRDLIESTLSDRTRVAQRPDAAHSLRAYAMWLFSETATYRELTGRGIGAREIGEVDELVARFLHANAVGAPRAILDHSRLGEPPQELHECSLAATVIVAHADGDLGDDEFEAIQKVFATLVPDWRDYMDLDVGLERFHETALVLKTCGSDLLRNLFQLLVHVMGADGQIDRREVEAILGVGRALGVEDDYRRLLSASLRALGLGIDVASIEAAEIRLPTRQDEASSAFDGFLHGVARRGERSITLRRLLRLLGQDHRNDAAIERIEKTCRKQGIELSADLREVPLDARLELYAPRAFRPQPPPPPPDPSQASRSALANALRRLREQLVSGDGRSQSVRLRKIRRSRAVDLMSLERVSTGLAERVLAQVREGKSARLIDAADAGRHAGASAVGSDLLALAREQDALYEETGAHDLYLGHPFITGVVDGYAVRAPLVLHPVDIDRDGAGARGYRLAMRRDEPPIVNQSLLRLIFNKKRFVFSEDLSDELDALASDSAQGADGVRRKLAEVGVALAFTASPLRPFADRDDALDGGKEFLEVEPCAVLGLFPQSNSDLLQDYDGLLQELGTSRADVNTLLASATALLPASLVGPRRDQADPSLDQGIATPVIRADPSQRTVIGECRRHGAMVIDGPPGTGKSQVIVNLIAEALRRGERVAVVCEKRAALDVVVQRLEGLGLRHAIGVVHDVHEDRKLLYEQIAARLEQVDARPFDAGEAARLEREHAESGQALKVRAQALRMRPEGLSLSTGEILSAASGIELDPIRVRGLDTIDQARLKKLLELATSLFPLTDLWAPDSRWRGRGGTERPELADADAHSLQRLEQAIEAAGNAAREHEAVVSRTTAPVDPIEHAREAVQVARRTRDLRQSPEDGALLLALAEGAPADIESATREIELTWTETGSAMERVARRIEFEPPPEFVTALSVLRSWAGSWIRFLVLGWWTARSAFRRELARSWPERAGERLELQLLDAVSDRIHASRGWRVASELLTRLRLGRVVPATASELGELVRRIARASKAARDLAKVRSRLVAAGAWPASYDESNLAAWEQTLDEHARLIQARAVLRQKAAAVTAAFPWIGELPTQSELDALLHDLRRDASRLVESDRLRSHARRILPEAPALFDALLATHAGQGPSVWRSAITKSWACAWIERVETSLIPGFGRLGTRADDQEVVQLAGRHAELEEELREVAIERVLARVDDAELLRTQAASKHERRTTVQKLREELLKETRKKRRIMPLRSFVRRYSPQGLLGVLPVWLLSPETMAILFPRQALFDLVIFDEASQCTVEAGIPVLLRAKRVVIAGDEKQMPPSSYFDLATESDDDGVPESSEAETQRELRDLLAEESLLKLARTRIAHRGLEWHYRCRDEALIAFSNHAMYHGELRTIPARTGPAAPSALRWVAVPDGSYQAGENRREAVRVVELMHELLTRDEPPSIGIVTFNLKQRRLVLDAIDERKASDPDFARRHAVASETDSLDERPFVKNLEQVQGDERDVIIFSLGHAPQERRTRGGTVAEKYVPARFGPLNARGGERRLNVAISRAKTECYIVASFEPAQLKVEAVTNEGPKLFKQYLEFAFLMHQGRHLEAERVLDLVRAARLSPHQRAPRSPIEGYVPLSTQIAMALEAEAIPHEINVGKSSFQVPIAVLDPSDPTRFALAILLEDGTGEVASFDPFDVHVHQPSVLRDRSWQALRITAASWHRRRREVLDEIERLVPGARGAANNEIHRSHREARRVIAAPPPPPPTRRLRKSSHPAIAVAQAPASVPSWAAAIENPHFQKALLQLAEHGSLGEVDVISIVGGPRKARLFARELESWRDRIPFRVEIVDVKGTKVYRKIGD